MLRIIHETWFDEAERRIVRSGNDRQIRRPFLLKDGAMKRGQHAVSDDLILFTSNVTPGTTQRCMAALFALGIIVTFFVSVSFSDNEPHLLPGFVLGLVVSMLLCDIVTAVLLFAQFSILRLPAILVIASGYLFTALILIGWTLTLPGVFKPGEGVLGGLQSAAGFYIAWRSGFAAFVISYILIKESRLNTPLLITTPGAVGLSISATVTLVGTVSFICIAGEPFLPRILADPMHYTPLYPYALGMSNGLLSVVAIALLWYRGRTTLDLWLMVVMFFYFMDLPLSYYPSPIRYTDGWYAVRLIAFLSSTLVLILLLHETTGMYSKLLSALVAQRREREARLVTGDAVAAMIAHEVKQPLTAMVNRAEAGFLWLDRQDPNLEKAKSALRQITADGHRAGAVIERVRANFQKEAAVRTSCDVNELIFETMDFVRGDLQRLQIAVQYVPNPSRPQILGDRVQLQQMLLNLVTNAIESMASKAGARVLCITTRVRDDGGLAVSVADTGTGIAIEHMERIFNPFYTTKSGGMGMGLSICRSIARAHAGDLSVEPNMPEGAKFTFVLNPTE
ncbi:ATP-binding protein [Bradyrhizobium sp. USDA 4473]